MRAADLFAGLGGFSEGARQAGGTVVWAANHWAQAVALHAANHPEAEHACQDLQQADWARVPPHDLLLASPACQGHSRARGREVGPKHDPLRSTAWAVVSAAEYHRPAFLCVENVPEFRHWLLYPAWTAALQALGYRLAEHVLDAADHGVPQHRRRLFIVGARARSAPSLRFFPQPHIPIGPEIRFGDGRWAPVDRPGRAPATLARIQAGRARHGDRFLTPYYGSGSGLTGRSLARPVGTVTTRDRWAVIDRDRMRMMTAEETRAAMGFPAGYALPADHKLAMHMLGNAVPPPLARTVIGALLEAA